MREGIPRDEEEAYFSSHSDSPEKGDKGALCIVMPRRPDKDAF